MNRRRRRLVAAGLHGLMALPLAALVLSPASGQSSNPQEAAGEEAASQSTHSHATADDPLPAAYGPPVPAGLQPDSGATEAPPGIPIPLARAAEQALATYPAIRAARTNITAAGHELEAAEWLRYPSVAVEAVTGRERLGDISPDLRITQPLWAGGFITGQIDRARALRDVAGARLEESAQEILLRLTSAYFEIARGIRLEEILRESVAEHQRLVESMQRRVAQEVSPSSDLELARSRAAQVQQELSLVVAQRHAALQRLRELVGEPAYDPGAPPAYSEAVHHPPSEGLVDRALACSPTVRRLTEQVDVAEAERRVSKASALPQVGVQYSYNEITGSQVGLAVRAQTNGGLSPLAQAEAATARRQASELEVAVAQRETRELVVLDLVENSTARTRIASSRAAVSSSATVTDSFMRQFITGRRTWLDVMNAVRESTAARIGLAEAEISAMASNARIDLRTCAWRPIISNESRQP